MRPRVVILSDLWGYRKNPDLHELFNAALPKDIDFTYIDSSELANIPKSISDQDEIHKLFINGGLTQAVNSLMDRYNSIDILIGLSIGGTIAWQYALQEKVEALYCLSSTRLRYESQKPNTEIHLLFGELDIYCPSARWFNSHNILPLISSNYNHDLYLDLKVINQVCNEVGKLID